MRLPCRVLYVFLTTSQHQALTVFVSRQELTDALEDVENDSQWSQFSACCILLQEIQTVFFLPACMLAFSCLRFSQIQAKCFASYVSSINSIRSIGTGGDSFVIHSDFWCVYCVYCVLNSFWIYLIAGVQDFGVATQPWLGDQSAAANRGLPNLYNVGRIRRIRRRKCFDSLRLDPEWRKSFNQMQHIFWPGRFYQMEETHELLSVPDACTQISCHRHLLGNASDNFLHLCMAPICPGIQRVDHGPHFGHIFGMFGMPKATWGCQYFQSTGCGSDLAARVRKCSCIATNCRQEAQKRPRNGPGARQQNHFRIQTFWCRMFCSELWCYAVFRHLMTYLMSPNTSQHLPLRSVPKNWYSKTFSLLIWPIVGDFFPITDVNWLSHGQPSCDSTSKATQETELAVRLSEHSVEPGKTGKTGRLIEDGSCTSLRNSHIFPRSLIHGNQRNSLKISARNGSKNHKPHDVGFFMLRHWHLWQLPKSPNLVTAGCFTELCPPHPECVQWF